MRVRATSHVGYQVMVLLGRQGAGLALPGCFVDWQTLSHSDPLMHGTSATAK